MDYNQCFKISLEQIYYFITVADEKNVSKAADKLFISQPFLSKNIMKIEEILNTNLFERSRIGFTLTPDGQILYDRWKKILRAYSESITSLSAEKKIDLGILNIKNPLGFIKEHFTEDILKLNIKADDLYQLYVKFKHGEYDAIITQDPFLPYINSDFEKKLLASVKMSVIFHKDHPFAKKENLLRSDLNGQNIILYCSNLNVLASYEESNKYYFDLVGIKPAEVIFTENFGDALINIGLNNGICFCDSFYADEKTLPPELVMKNVLDFDADYYLCYRDNIADKIKKLVNS